MGKLRAVHDFSWIGWGLGLNYAFRAKKTQKFVMKSTHPEEPEIPRIDLPHGVRHKKSSVLDFREFADQLVRLMKAAGTTDSQFYVADECEMERFSELFFCPERQTWVARFTPAEAADTELAYSDATYSEVLQFARFLHESRIKPSESYRALLALDAHFDQELARITSSRRDSLPQSPKP